MRKLVASLLLLTSCFAITGCDVYSFTGASISPEIKTISIASFPNQASLVQPSLSQVFTEKLKDKFVSQTNLTRYADYDSKQNLSTVENQLISEICNQLVDDIFNKAMINW